jgi:uncharacterized membrane-anchored protein
MKLPSRHHNLDAAGAPAVTGVTGVSGVTGTVRMDRRTGSLLRRLQPGDIAVIDHLDLDRADAEALVGCGVVAVVNASPFISGRYPNLGPELLAGSGVVMVDEVGPEVFSRLEDGSRARVQGGAVLLGPEPVVSGRELGAAQVAALMQDARSGLSAQLQSLTHNTTEFLRREPELLLHGQGIPDTVTAIRGRPVVVVVRGHDHRDDLRRLRRFVREQHPVLIGVDAGADALLAAGHRPDIVVAGEEGLASGSSAGDHGSTVSDRALHAAREVVLHADRSGRTLGEDRLSRLGIAHQTLSASGMTEDMALLLADARGASLVVTVGTHATLDELLDRQRTGPASTVLTRLRLGRSLVDAKAVPVLYSGRARLWQLALVLLAGFVALGLAVATTPAGREWWSWVAGALSGALSGPSSGVRAWLPGPPS